MRNVLRTCIFWMLSLILSFEASGATFRRLRAEDGLAHNDVRCLMQDRTGFIWIGSEGGLNCYDGSEVKTLHGNEEMAHTRVTTLLDAGADSVWIGTDRGVCIYRRSTGEMTSFRGLTRYGVVISSEVCKIIRHANGSIYIGTLGQGIFRYGADGLKQYISQTSFAADLAFDEAGKVLFVATLGDEVLKLSLDGKTVGAIRTDTPVRCFLLDGNRLWMGMERNRWGYYVTTTGECRTFTFSGTLHTNTVQCLLREDKGGVLAGTDYGLFRFDPQLGQFVKMQLSEGTTGVSAVTSLLKDKEGSLWIGTSGGGVGYLSGQDEPFHAFMTAGSEWDAMRKNITSFCEDPDGNLYIGTEQGVFRRERASGHIAPLPLKGIPQAEGYNIRSLFMDGHILWVGTWGDGLLRVDLTTLATQVYTPQVGKENTLTGRYIQKIYKGAEGRLYIGLNNGLCYMDERTETFYPVTVVGAMVAINDIFEDSRHNLWVATAASGIFRRINSGGWKHYHYGGSHPVLFSNNVTVIHEDASGLLRIGTNGSGLGHYDAKKDLFVTSDAGVSSIIPGKVVYAIEQDEKGYLWVSTNKGLVRMETSHPGRYRLFNSDDGLPDSPFNPRASVRLHDGEIAFGGANGFITFMPASIRSNTHIPSVCITGVSFPLQEGNEADAYANFVRLPRKIELPYTKGSFTLHFAALSFEAPQKNTYQYRMQGVDKEWLPAGGEATAAYANLSPGTYLFEVKGANNSGVWNEHPAVLQVVITPPWWLSLWAKIVYALLAVALLGALLKYVSYRVKRKYRQHIEEYAMRREKEMYRQKISFFVNLVHEIRTPLSLIRLPLEHLMNESDVGNTPDRHDLLQVIHKNVDYLMNIVNQLLDFQKMEKGEVAFSRDRCDVSLLVRDVGGQFEEPAHLKQISLQLELPTDEVYACIDRDKLSKILVNLLGNALKYARTRIRLSMRYEAERLYFCIDDDGQGIPPEEREKVFTAFYRLHEGTSAPTGTGIGLAYARSLAEKQGGSLVADSNGMGGARFVLELPAPAEGAESPAANDTAEGVQSLVDEAVELQEAPASDKRITVLIVEDNADLLRIVGGELSRWYRVKRASNGREALDVLGSEDVDIVVSDVMMPVMDGIELCRHIKEHLETSHIPVVLLTAHTTLEAKREGLQCGADVYLEKPFLISQLHAQIGNLLRLRQQYYKQMMQVDGHTRHVVENTDGMGLSKRDREFAAQLSAILEARMADESFSVDELAEALGMSRSNFYRKIKALYNLPPNDYLKQVRLNKAAALLKEGARVSEVYVQVGFNSPSYFTKCFKACFGMLPKDYASGGAPGKE